MSLAIETEHQVAHTVKEKAVVGDQHQSTWEFGEAFFKDVE